MKNSEKKKNPTESNYYEHLNKTIVEMETNERSRHPTLARDCRPYSGPNGSKCSRTCAIVECRRR